MNIKKWFAIAVFALSFPVLTGCWDRLEIEDRGTILGLAIDPIEGEMGEGITGPYAKSDLKGYRLTAQVAIPGRIPLGPGEGSTGGGVQRPVWVVSTTGKTIDDAVNNLQQELADKLFLGHLRVIIVNQKLARSTGVDDIQDFFRRNAEIRRLAWMVISVGDASNAMAVAPKLERVPTLYLVGTMDHSVALGKLPNVYLGNFWATFSSKGREPVLPMIEVSGDKVESEGLAVFSGGRMVGILNPLETAAYMEIENQRRAGYGVAVPIPGDPKHSVIVKGSNRNAKIKMHMENGRPAFDVYCMIEANIEEKTGHKHVDDIIDSIGVETQDVLVKGQQELIAKMQNLHADVFGFGEYVRGRAPDYWVNQVGGSRVKWDEMFATTPVHVHVRVYMRRSGMSTH
ncbi:Ger(x)C family spore germination protein [Alicyclobacillus fastidiosus]|uniref:Ger(X)C family spore germination protein n=1 Tax=Alicyclobacillus fastidiosus TaxID=392011 RepID=A0ABV5AII1_9BACL|nr:Ger(x)C family spore germination protein [Alicyclobacillus fastidiosus]WEH10146.1 Ger(x)C family spore germination protein [Alicyclobacillus fastidiosus]